MMIAQKKPRVMWLINHSSARKFEVPMLKQLGFEEIFTPKKFPHDPAFLSASVDFSEDEYLTIPQDALEVINRTDWYDSPSDDAWEIANKYFEILFFVANNREQIRSISRNFRGMILCRSYGAPKDSANYSNVLDLTADGLTDIIVRELGNRFWFAHAYSYQAHIERPSLRSRAVHLPLGMARADIVDQWRGDDKKVLFVCPNIRCSAENGEAYRKFVNDFHGMPYVIGGEQPIKINDAAVLGYTSHAEYERNLRENRLMFYHSIDPNHIHYHPFEAVRVGTPLIYMAGGVLDRLGGGRLPGRAKTIKEARTKITRILKGDNTYIASIRNSQSCLLDEMTTEGAADKWSSGMTSILTAWEKIRSIPRTQNSRPRRIAVILPAAYRGGTLRAVKLLAEAIHLGAQQAHESVEVVFAHLDDSAAHAESEFADLSRAIKRRPFKWRALTRDEARRALIYAGKEQILDEEHYQIPDDGINQFLDCHTWVIVSDRLEKPILPLRPNILVVYDYLQRYFDILSFKLNNRFTQAARTADRVLVTTEFTRQNAIQYAGVRARDVLKVPMLAPLFERLASQASGDGYTGYFLWTTNLAPHKNHAIALQALRIYYEKYDGNLECRVTGVNTETLLSSNSPHLKNLKRLVDASDLLRRRLRILGELEDSIYQRQLADSQFLFHAARSDNGTFSVVEAAHLGVPSLSSDYPAMREIDAQFQLHLTWMTVNDPNSIAQRIKYMEVHAQSLRSNLPDSTSLESQSIERLAGEYWKAVKTCQ
jgi:glycosyltransferase involved in cell wall biosynthesis